jgi:exonuclease SbcC
MRPLRLELKGFTAFRDPVEIDFTTLDVFAISGPTGSGKSSLLDAITYALYGRVERVGDRVKQLVSQGQPRMAVTLDFEVGRDRYRVTRSTFTDKRATKITLARLEGDREVSLGEGADRVAQADKMLERAIGLTYDGFTRSVLLPQGKFAEFLVGDPKKRRDILTELLGLSLFRRMAERAREISGQAKAGSEAAQRLLSTQYAEVDQDAVETARLAAKEALVRCEAMAEIELSIEAAAEQWQEAAARLELLTELTKEMHEMHRSAEEVASGLEGAAERAQAAEREAEAARRAWEAAARKERSAAARLAEAQQRLGTPQALAVAESTLKELTRIEAGLEGLERQRTAAHGQVEGSRKALEAAEKIVQETGSEVNRLAEEKREAAREHEAAHSADKVAAVVAGRAVGDPCPVCGHPLERLPPGDGRALARALKALQLAERALERAERAYSKAERAVFENERDVAEAEREIARLEAESDGRRREREQLLPGMAEVFGGEIPLDPLGELARRDSELQEVRGDAEEAERAARDAEQAAAAAALRAERAGGEGVALIARLRAIPVARLLERVRATVPGVAVPPSLVGGVPDEPAEALTVARVWGEGTAGLVERLAAEAEAARASQERLLQETRRLLPEDVPVDAGTDLETIQRAVRLVAKELDRAATAAEKDVERLAERLEERRRLEDEIAARSREGTLFGALALELQANHLIAFLQAEALQILAFAASDRLSNLSDGRYRLVCREDEFFVIDTWNGDEERSVRTLSGGETFLASLALALALADQVRSLSVTDRARLDSLFLDEGFGTLDQEALRVVVDAMEALGGDGRLVGVITHVRELAEQFPRVEVDKSPRGSRLNVVSA